MQRFILFAFMCDFRLVVKDKGFVCFGWTKINEGERSLNEG